MATRTSDVGKGIEVVGIAVDSAAKVIEFANKMQIDYPILLADVQGLELIRNLGNQSGGLPFTVFLDRAGAVLRTKLGLLKPPELAGILAALPKE